MKKFKRLLALALAVTMLAGLVPANVMPVDAMSWRPTKEEQTQNQVQTPDAEAETRAVSDVVDAALFFSDLHTEQNNYKDSEIKAVMKGVAKSGLDFSSITSVGDAFSSENTVYIGTTSKITESIRNGLGDSTVPVFYAWSDHDRGADIDNYTGLMYGDDKANAKYYDAEANYYIYTISMSDMSSAERYGVASTFTEDKLTKFTEVINGLDHSKPLFIATHQPLHDRRDDNEYADKWYGVISAAAEKMDIAVFWGHNHTSETDVDRAAYYVAKDGKEKMTVEGVGNIVPNFTYLNAGYMNNSRYNADSTREYVATAVAIYKDTINYTLYDENGVYDGNDSLNETIEREFAVSEEPETPVEPENPETPEVPEDTIIPEGYKLSSIAVSEDVKTNYFVGEEFDIDSLKVQAVYGKEGNEDIICDIAIAGENEDGYTVSEVDTAVAGTYTVTVSYEGITTSFDIEVFEKVVSDSNTGISIETTVAGAVEISVNTVDTTNEVIAAAVSEVLENYVGYDIKLDGHNTGDVVKVTLPVPEGVTNPKVYYVSDDGSTVTNMNAVKSEDGKTVTFETDHFSVYLVGEGLEEVFETESGNAVVESTIQTIPVWKFTDSLTSAGTYLIVNRNSEGPGYALLNNSGSLGSASVTVVNDSTNDPYIILDNDSAVWTATGSNSGWTFDNSGSYLSWDSKTSTSGVWGTTTNYKYSLALKSNSENWIKGTNTLYVHLITKASWMSNEEDDFYLAGDDSWSMGTNSSNVYFYTPGTIFVGTEGGEYSVEGTDISNILAINGTTIDLSSKLYWTPESGEISEVTNHGLTPSYEVVTTKGTPSVISSFDGAKAILSGNVGTAVVRVTYTSGELTAWDEFTITTVAPVYNMTIDSPDSYMIKKDASLELTVTTTLNDEVMIPAANSVTWSSSNTDIASVDPNTGVVTANTVGSVDITATYMDPNGNTHTDVITLEVVDNVYDLNLHYAETIVDENGTVIDYDLGEEITAPIPIKNVVAGQSYTNIWAVITKDGIDMEQLSEDNLKRLSFESSDPNIAEVDPKTGKVTFKGITGKVIITASYKYEEDKELEASKSVTDEIIFVVSDNNYYIPEDGTDDFPEYPNKGSVRLDKTATAVGNFSETGVAKLELSMTGVPFTEGNRMDVVLMLDRSSSMYKAGVQHRISSTVEAAKAFVKNIVMNEDGTFNDNRIMVMDFLGGNLDRNEGGGNQHVYESNLYTEKEENGYQVINNQTELDALLTKIENDFKGQTSLYGTEYAQGLSGCYDALHASKDDGNKQFCVFMSDGIPNYMMGEKTHFKKTDDIVAMFDVLNYNRDNATAARNATKYEYEYYSTQMKNEGVTVFTVGLGLKNKNSAWSNASATACEQVASMLLNDISGPAGETAADRDTASAVSKLDKYFYSVADENAAENMKDVFSSIAKKIHEAAKDVKVTDQITEDYTMIFESPNTEVTRALPEDQDFYIELNEYFLKPVDKDGEVITNNTGVIADYIRGTSVSLMKVYLGKDSNGYYAAKDNTGSAESRYDEPIFVQTPVGTKYYWTTDSSKGDQAIAVPSGNTTYYFVADGTGDYNMSANAYANGTPVATDIAGKDYKNTLCDTLILATPYFVYNAATKMLVWTAEKLSSTELALTYFLYLNNSGGYVGTDNETLADTYPTNVSAELQYTNHKGNDCEQIFPVPQMTWNGAQVSYVFYLVNEDGIPVNRAGRPLPFSEAVYVTDVYTHSVVWNRNDATAGLSANYLASEKVPEVYELYDNSARYIINVYENENGTDKNNRFVIEGAETVNTTYVFNTKADKDKYTKPDVYTKENVHEGFDFSNTTVAFAVLWKPELTEDVVVIDYGLPVDIDVTKNDHVTSVVTGLSDDYDLALQDVTINKGQITNMRRYPLSLEPGDYTSMKFGRAEVTGATTIRYTPQTMSINDIDRFYYIASLEYYDKAGSLIPSYMYSSVTVIPATTIYYEDSFVAYNNGGSVQSGLTETDIAHGEWTTAGKVQTGVTQQQDRPGPDKISAALDADNVYGYDQAYMNCTEYSLGSAQKVTVSTYNNPNAKYHPEDANKEAVASWPSATFTFTGAGFDIISLTSRETGLIKVDVTGTETHSWLVDTYYGYNYNAETGEWEVSTETTPNDLYQIPVIKSGNELQYGTYTVTITPMYSSGFDHAGSGSYDFYLDAIRIYDPANDGVNNKEIADAYKADKEGWPAYTEVRNMLIAKEDFYTADGTTKGIIFIDGIPALDDSSESAVSDYTNYGPNNEVYLAPGQAVAFKLNTGSSDIADVQLAVKAINGDVSYKMYDAGTTAITRVRSKTVKTATDLYESVNLYDEKIEELNGKTIVIANDSTTEGRVLSITNIKVTFNSAPGTELDLSDLMEVDQEVARVAMFSLRRPVVEDLPTEDDTNNDDVIEDDTTTDDGKEEIDTPSENPTISDIAHAIIRDIVDTVKGLKNFFKR